MRVTFTRTGRRQYEVSIEREHGPRLVPRGAPGYDDRMPHDLAHYLVEEVFGIRLGVFGQLAAGGAGIFAPAKEDRTARVRRTEHRLAVEGRADMGRSERLVHECMAAWQHPTGGALSSEVARAVVRFEEMSRRWQAVPMGGSLTLTFNPAAVRH